MEKKNQQIKIATIAKELCFSDNKERELLQNRSIKQLIEGFIIEKNAKNEAFYFILENGHFDAFRAYCKNIRKATN